MIDWLTGRPAKKFAGALCYLFFAAYITQLGCGLFGGAHAAFWHIHPKGYVPIRIASRYGGGHTAWVKPWVAQLDSWCLWTMFGSVGAILVLALCVVIAKKWAGIPLRPPPHQK